MRFLVGELERAKTPGAGQGVDTFENVLQLFGLSGAVDDNIKKTLWEMNHIRNVIVHRDSLADLRLVRECPRLKLKVGDRVLVNEENYGSYHDAVYEYLKVLARRLAERYDAPVPRWAIREAGADSPPVHEAP